MGAYDSWKRPASAAMTFLVHAMRLSIPFAAVSAVMSRFPDLGFS
jgi:hypothetical protein